MNAVQYVFSVVKSCTHDYTCDNEWKRGTVTSRLRKTDLNAWVLILPYSRKDGCFYESVCYRSLRSTRYFLLLCRYKFIDKFRTEKSDRVDVKYFPMGHVPAVFQTEEESYFLALSEAPHLCVSLEISV